MPEMKRHEPGTFCWADLATHDPAGAKRFYGELFGWKTEDVPAGKGSVYTMARIRGLDVAALMGMMGMGADRPAQTVRSHWKSYVAVAEVDETIERAVAAGGVVLLPPEDVMDAGRMAVLTDPSGAEFSLWQPKRHSGAGLLHEPGALTWMELATADIPSCQAFYTRLFGWGAKVEDMGSMKYTLFTVGQKNVGGMMPLPREAPPNTPSHWTVYFNVADCDQSAARAKALGATTVVPPTDIPKTGRFAMHFDPQGAIFGMIQLASMP